jgi:PAS domain S-box-containing protein
MAKKSVRAKLPVKNKKKSSIKKNPKQEDQLKRSQSFSMVDMENSADGPEVFKTLAENAPDVIFRVDHNLRFVFVNKKISELTGIPKEQFYGKTLLDLGLPKDICIYLGKQAQEVFDHRTLNEFEFSFNGPEGLRWFHARIVPEFDNRGNVETALGIAHEITDLKRAELAYREERAFRDSIMSSLRIGIAAVDLEGRQSYVNPSFCKMVGWSEEELEGVKPPFVYWPPEEIGNITRAFQQIMSGKDSSGNIELRFQRRNGERFDAFVLFSPLKDGQGGVIGWIWSIGDITEHKKKDEEIQKLNWELEQSVIERTAELDATNKRLQESEQKACLQLAELETMYDSTPVGLCMFDPNLTYLRINKRLAEINGVPAKDHIGRTPWEVVPELAGQAEALLRQIIETGEPILNVEIKGETPAQPGVLRTWLEHWLPLKDTTGKLIGVNVVAEEITERKRAEEALRESRAKLQAAFASMTEAIFIADADGRLTDFNDEFVRYHRFRDRAECSKTVADCPDYLDAFFEDGTPAPLEMWAMPRALRGEMASNVEYKLRRKDTGETWWGSYSFAPIKDKDGRIIGGIVAGREITERKRAEEEIKTLNEDLRRRTVEFEIANKELEAFTYSVSHDLKAPLIVASGFCRRLSERCSENLDDKGSHYLQRIQESCQQMNLLIEDLLNLSKVTTSKIKLKIVDLSDLVKSVATQLKEIQPEREVSFIIEEGLTAKGDPSLLRIALENLLGNAWKFTSKSKRAKIEFGLMKTIRDEPTYFVRDNGSGFDMSMLDKLFKPFQRLHGDEEFSGTGVGLATVHRIITRHNGRIWAESAVGKGTTFFFTLPT